MKYISRDARRVKNKRPLEPFVSREQILAFDPELPETFTESRVLNEVLLAIETEGLRTSGEIAAYLAVDSDMLRYGLQLVTGLMVNDIVRLRMIGKLVKIKEANPAISTDEAARAAGYSDRATLYKVLGREEYDRLFAKYVKTQ